MISDIFRQFIDDHKTGLGIVELPTSIGKTYSTFECIAKYTEDWAEYAKTHVRKGTFRQILFVTSRKNNLQNGRRQSADGEDDELQGLRKAYANRGRLDKYDEEVLFLNALSEILKDNLNTLTSNNVIQPNLCKLPEYEKLTKKVVQMTTSQALQEDRELYDEVSREATKLYFEFRKRILPAYRHEKNENRKMTLADLGEMEGYGWLFNLYPDLLIPKRKVLLMSFNKLLDGRAYERPECAFRSSQFLKNKIVIIDEFDSTKQIVKDSLAAEQSEHQVDFLQLFHNIYSGARTIWASPSFEEIDQKLGDINYSLEKVMERAEKRRLDYKLDYTYKTDGDLRDTNQAFIFMDNATRTITKTGGGMQIVARPSEGSVSLLLCRREDKLPGDFYLDGTIRWVTGFLKQFANYVQRLASNYAEQRNKESEDTPEASMSFEDAFRSYLYKYGISRNEMTPNHPTRLLLDMADASNISNSRRYSGLRQGYDYYVDGFTYYSMADAPHHDDNTIVFMVDIPITAESMIVKMSKSALLIGMSATAGIPSVTGNYNLNWCQDNIDDYFDLIEEYPDLSREVDDFLRKRYEPYRDGRIIINTHVIDNGKIAQNQSNIFGDCRTAPCKILKEWGIPDKEAIRIETLVRRSLQYVDKKEYNYSVLRYYNLLKVMLDFAGRKHMQSLIYLGSKAADGCEDDEEPTGRNKFDVWTIRELVCAVNHHLKLSKDEKIGVAYVCAKGFDTTMDNIRWRLSDKNADGSPKTPERLVIISTYASVGVGQNLQYPAPDSYLQYLVRLIPRGKEKADTYRDKDIDGIYLGDITHLVSNFGSDKITEKDLILNIFQAEELNANWEITPETKENNIRTAFNHLGESYPAVNELRPCESIRSERSRQVIQAVGRIGRSNQRCKEINIYIDSSVLYGLHKETLERRFSSPEMEEITRLFDNYNTFAVTEQQQLILNRAATISDRTSEAVNRRRMTAQHEGYWEASVMEWWQEMRELVKKYPTATQEERDSIPFIKFNYIDNGGQPVCEYLFSVNNRYYEHQRVWFGDEEGFKSAGEDYRPYPKSKDDHRPKVLTMSEENMRLSIILKYPGLRKWWISRGYAEHIEPKSYIMSPFLYTEIYKGSVGEEAGKFILQSETDWELIDITDPEKFEKADFEIKGRSGEYVDFKHYSAATIREGSEELKNALDKLESLGGKRMYIMNIIKGGGKMVEQPKYFFGQRIIVFQWMINEEGKANNYLKTLLLL